MVEYLQTIGTQKDTNAVNPSMQWTAIQSNAHYNFALLIFSVECSFNSNEGMVGFSVDIGPDTLL